MELVPPHGGRWEETPTPIFPALLSLQGDPAAAMEGASVLSPSSWEKRRAWVRQSRCWRTTVVEEEAAAAMQDVPELQPPHLDDVFLEGPRGCSGNGGPPLHALGHLTGCFCPLPPPPQEAPPAR